jgi:ribonuclease HI
MQNIFVYTDGGARGNPGPAAIGVYIENEKGEKLYGLGKKIGETTNNVAEYSAIIEAYNWLLLNRESLGENSKIYFYMDSLLAYSHIKKIYKIKNENLRQLVFTIWEKEKQLSLPVSYAHVRREGNTKADFLVNQALDNLI